MAEAIRLLRTRWSSIRSPIRAERKSPKAKATLNAFGSAWGSLELGEAVAARRVPHQFWDQGRSPSHRQRKLFRLEEYKLPEFKVAVKTPEQDGKKKAFRLGEKVEVEIQADYYFGGPVSNASVEVVVYQNPFYHYWFRAANIPGITMTSNNASRLLRRRPGSGHQTRDDQD